MINKITPTENQFDAFWDEMDLRIENAVNVIKRRGGTVGKQATLGIFFDGGFYDKPIKEFLKLAGVDVSKVDNYTEDSIFKETLLECEKLVNVLCREKYGLTQEYAVLLAPVDTKLMGFDIIMIMERVWV